MVSGHSGSHVRLSKVTAQGKIGTVVPRHDELKPGTLKSVLKLAKVDPEEFAEYPVNARCPPASARAP
jgi:hypothetical protein